MTARDQLMRLHAEEARLEREADALARRLDGVAENIEAAKSSLEASWRREHWGHDPERPFAWRDRSAARRPQPRDEGRARRRTGRARRSARLAFPA